MRLYLGKVSTVPLDETNLLTEAHRINYRLRSTFFYRKLREYKTLSLQAKINALLPVSHLYSWEGWAKWGIGEEAFTYINQHPNLQLIQVFCHPRLIREHSLLLAYYRNITVLSQKAVKYLAAVDVKKIELDDFQSYNKNS
jgi:hypothetical protein